MARQKKEAIDFSMILFLRMLQNMPDGTPQQNIARMHDLYLENNQVGIRYASAIGNSNGRITRTVQALRKVGLITSARELTIYPPLVQNFWKESGMDMDNWRSWALLIPFDDEDWLDFSNATFVKKQ